VCERETECVRAREYDLTSSSTNEPIYISSTADCSFHCVGISLYLSRHVSCMLYVYTHTHNYAHIHVEAIRLQLPPHWHLPVSISSVCVPISSCIMYVIYIHTRTIMYVISIRTHTIMYDVCYIYTHTHNPVWRMLYLYAHAQSCMMCVICIYTRTNAHTYMLSALDFLYSCHAACVQAVC